MPSIIFQALNLLIYLIGILILVRCVLSWIPGLGEGSFASFIIMLTEPVLAPVRRLLFRFEILRSLPIDFSPIVAWLLLSVLKSVIYYIYLLF